MRIILAPMEGVLDGNVRSLLTQINDYDLCVTEFVRVVNTLLPNKTYYRLCPELYNHGLTASGTPVRVQLLGSSPCWLAENAVKAIELGSNGIDLNCGCPAKKVVGSEGGASLLKTPEHIYQITKAVREAIPCDQVLSVKIRLGWQSANERFEIADAVAQGGASEIAVHGRTKEDGYKADKINWQAIGDIQKKLTIPVIANGEIFSLDDAKSCIKITKCNAIMVGRGAVQMPNLANMIKHQHSKLPWQEVVNMLINYINSAPDQKNVHYHTARIKQWFCYLRKSYKEADLLFIKLRTVNNKQDLLKLLEQEILF